MPPSKLYSDSSSEIWLGSSLDPEHVKEIMGNRKADALIFDAPFSDITHKGHANGKLTADRAAAFANAYAENPTPESRYSARKSEHGESGRRDIDYAHFTEQDVINFCDIWVPRNNGWSVSITDDILGPIWRQNFERHGKYGFAPVPLVETGSRVRMSGDGSACWTVWVMTARPRHEPYSKWGALKGAYIVPGERVINSSEGTDRIVGGKSIKAMIDITKDYSRENDLVVDPFAGGCTQGKACIRTNRRFIGVEKDPERAKLCAEIMYAESKMVSRKSVSNGQQTLF